MSSPWFMAFAKDDEHSLLGFGSLTAAHSTVRYQSGNVWVVADTSHSRLVVAEAGTRRLALIGETNVDASRLAQFLARHQDADELLDEAHK